VKNITDYGAFIDLGGIDGLLHITDMSWGRVGHPSELFKVNDEVDVIVLKYDPATERVSLGHKAARAGSVGNGAGSLSGWRAHERQGRQPDRLRRVRRARARRRGLDSRQRDVVEQARQAPVEDPQRRRQRRGDGARRGSGARRISLGLKQVESNPWHELGEKYPVGTKIKGKVRNLTEFGAFVEVEEDIDGLIHISDMSWSKRVKHPSEVLKKGDVVEAMVLSIDAENQRLSLGLKQLATDIWDDFFSRHNVGDVVEGKITRMTNFGAFVELDEGIEGLIHVSEFDDSHGGEKIDLQVGTSYQMKIIKLSPQERKIGLSIRAMKSDGVPRRLGSVPGRRGHGHSHTG
jgi:small subunit ribosomal protein S1